MNQTEIKNWGFRGDGLIIFPEPSQVIKAYKLIRTAGIDAHVVTTHPKLRFRCCALGLEVSLSKRHEIEQLFLERDVEFDRIITKQIYD